MFNTIYGNGICKDLFKLLENSSIIIVTQQNLYDAYGHMFPQSFSAVCIDNVEEAYLAELNTKVKAADAVVGFGGGMSIDAAKYFSWKREIPCYLVPTAVSVDACYSYPIALRKNNVVYYDGEVLPEAIYVDYDIIRSAPKALNLSGVGDVLSCYTGLYDWTIMDKAGKGQKIVKEQYDTATELLEGMFAAADEIAVVSDKGIKVIMDAYRWVGIEGYGCRYCHFEEGSEHFLAYTIESICGKHLLHGQLVCMCAYIMSKLQKEGRQKRVSDFCKRIGLQISYESVGLTEDELRAALKKVNAFALENKLSYSVLNEKEVTDDFIDEALKEVSEL